MSHPELSAGSDAASAAGTGPTRSTLLTPALIAFFAVACGLCVANIYYAQTLISLIAPDLGLPAGLAGLIVSFTQLGFGAGLLLIVPLSDLVENRRLVALAMGCVVLGLGGIVISDSTATYLLASFVLGAGAVASPLLVLFASQLTPPESRGRVVGTIMGGLVTGIMLARPIASYVASELGWRAVFALSCCLMTALIVILLRVLPRHVPTGGLGYRAIMSSLPRMVARTPLLRRRAFFQGMLFATFNLFWTGAPLLLMREFGMGHKGIALFALAGAAGALAAPIAGRLADRGLTRLTTCIALATCTLASLISALSEPVHSLVPLVMAALLIDAAVQVNHVVSLRCLYLLPPELRGRLNGLYLAFVFLCGAGGSALAAALYEHGNWIVLAATGELFGAVALLAFLIAPPRRVSPVTQVQASDIRK